MKYIIEIEDEPNIDAFDKSKYYKCKQVPYWYVSENIKNKLTPYTEPDRKDIEDAQEEAWEFAKQVSIMSPNDKYELWGTSKYNTINLGYSYAEAKAAYEVWKKQKDEIHVGDEVQHKKFPELKIYVTDTDDNSFGGFALCNVEDVCDYGDRFSECNVHQYKPTGRVLPNIVELLKKMRGTDED